MNNLFKLFVLLLTLTVTITGNAQKKKRRGEIYFSWGYNTEKYTNSNVKVKQNELQNDYMFAHVHGHDHKGWDEGLFSKELTIPQYNYRLGYLFGDKKNLGVEINFDHTKFIFADGPVQLKGTLQGRKVDTTINFNQANGFWYYLNNGANFLLFNIVKRAPLYTNKRETIKLAAFGKAGIGPVIPHVENSFFGQANNPNFQFGGWNVGAEAALRANFFSYAYLEFASKLDYARYSNLKIYKGTARHAFGTAEFILSLGVSIPAGKKQ